MRGVISPSTSASCQSRETRECTLRARVGDPCPEVDGLAVVLGADVLQQRALTAVLFGRLVEWELAVVLARGVLLRAVSSSSQDPARSVRGIINRQRCTCESLRALTRASSASMAARRAAFAAFSASFARFLISFLLSGLPSSLEGQAPEERSEARSALCSKELCGERWAYA